jgi:4-diphosphocytidyl-2-C-methyl-D-erythritol kinase
MRFFSPAKLNLFFRVLYKREDQYHEIASLFQAVSLGDFLSIEMSEEDVLSCNDLSLLCDRSNLIMKALDLFRKKTGIKIAVKVHLEKNIPLQSGLGGGSSNAATTLWGLNELCGRPASLRQLQNWSSEIGSDIPFFFL